MEPVTELLGYGFQNSLTKLPMRWVADTTNEGDIELPILTWYVGIFIQDAGIERQGIVDRYPNPLVFEQVQIVRERGEEDIEMVEVVATDGTGALAS